MGDLKPSSGKPKVILGRASSRRNPLIAIAFLATLAATMTQSGCVSLAGGLSLSQSNLNFGKVAIGQASSQTLIVKNSGSGLLTLTSVAASGRDFTVSGPQLPLRLAEGQSATFMARFAPPAPGETSGSLQITESQTASTPQLSGSGGSATPSIMTIQKTVLMAGTGVSAAPSITSQPASQNVAVGQTATFSVTISGATPLDYQWSKNGAAIPGATSASYTTPAAAATDSGSKFTVTVGNSAGSVTSNAAILTVGSAGQLTASATKLSYGNVAVGTSSSQSVTLTNTGNASVSISNVSVSGAGVSAGGVSSGLILAPANSAVLSVTFTPSSTGTLNGSVAVASNASDAAVTIALSGAAVQAASHSVTLGLAPDSSNVVGYNVYRSSVSSGPYVKLNSPLITSTTYTDTAVAASNTYYYVATSVDSAGDETVYSNQVSATIPTP
jgi:centrosomal CEP192-like protein/Ig-like domain-containing protein/HYDIN/CFA65/VesB family protein